MKILHTSDWHLGKKLEHFSRIDEQHEVLEEIATIAKNEAVDAIIIAGDLFDTFNPPVEAIELFYNSLKKLSNNASCPVIAIAGNHDSPDRIAAPDPLAKLNGIILIGNPQTTISEFTTDQGFSVTKTAPGFFEILLPNDQLLRIVHTAFPSEQRCKISLDKEKKETLSSYLKDIWADIAKQHCDSKGINVLVSHILMSESKTEEIHEPDDEKPIEHISERMLASIVPESINYVALGHLHRMHRVSNRPCPVYYSGSPIAYSFSESNQTKQVLIIEKDPGKDIHIQPIALTKGKRLFKKKFVSFDDAKKWLVENPDCLIECTIESNEYFKPSDLKQLHQLHTGIVSIIPDIKKSDMENDKRKTADLSKSREQLFIEYFHHKFDQNPNDEILSLFKEIIAE